jgi:hypothetical protein
MLRLFVFAFAASALAACGGSVCTRVNDQNTRIFAGKTKCEVTEGSSTLSVSRDNSSVSQCESNVGKCSSADLALLNDWAKCLEGVPACTTGNEKAAITGTLTCAATLFDSASGTVKVSADCLKAFE